MARKVKLAFIDRDSARRAAYKKRTKGLLKKLDELTTLCGIDACAVIHSEHESSPVIWPDRERAQRVVDQFRRMPQMDQKRRMYDHPAYLRHRIEKAAQELKRLQRETRWKEVTIALHGCLTGEITPEGMNKEKLSELGWLIGMNLEEIDRRLQFLQQQQQPLLLLPPPEPKPEQQQPQPLQMLPPPEPEMELGIPFGRLGPMGRLLLGIGSDEADTYPPGQCSQVAPGGSGGASG